MEKPKGCPKPPIKIMEFNELHKGQLITILRWHERDLPNFFTGQMQTVRDGSWVGEVLEVIALLSPFVVVKPKAGCLQGVPISLDYREVELMPVSEEYAAALDIESHDSINEFPELIEG